MNQDVNKIFSHIVSLGNYSLLTIFYAVIIKHVHIFLSCRKHIGNLGPKKKTFTNKIITQPPRCAECVAKMSKFIKKPTLTHQNALVFFKGYEKN